MKKKLNIFLSIVLPNRRINLFTIFIIILGIISGSIFLVALKDADKQVVTNQISNFMSDVNLNKINNIDVFKNALLENGIYIFLVWILGASIIGIIINVFLTYLRGFVVGFSVSSFIMIYKYKGLLSSFIYVFPTTIISLLITTIISTYSFVLSIMLLRSLFNRVNSITVKNYLKKYGIILIICLIMTIVSSTSEAFLLPSMMKLVIKMFI